MGQVTFINRVTGATNNMVYLETTDTLAAATTAGYIAAQQANIDALNDGAWQWETNDAIMVSASDAIAWCSIDSTFSDLTIFSALTLNAVTKSGAVVSGNFPKWSGTSGVVVDSGIAVANLQISSLTNPDEISDLAWHDVACSAAALATGGEVVIQASSGSKQYKIRDIRVNYSASGLSGGGGDRLLQITDGTTVYNNAGITAALLGTPVNTIWGGSGNPLAGTVAMNTSSVAAAAIVAKYAGGTTDFASGTVNISVLTQRVA